MKNIFDYESSGDEGAEPRIDTYDPESIDGRREIIDSIMKKQDRVISDKFAYEIDMKSTKRKRSDLIQPIDKYLDS